MGPSIILQKAVSSLEDEVTHLVLITPEAEVTLTSKPQPLILLLTLSNQDDLDLVLLMTSRNARIKKITTKIKQCI